MLDDDQKKTLREIHARFFNQSLGSAYTQEAQLAQRQFRQMADALKQALADSDALAVAQRRIEELTEEIDRLCGGR